MSPLAALQQEFLDTLFADSQPRGERAQVYRRNLLANAHGALAAAYPVVARLVGTAFFRAAAERYALAHPSRSGDLNEHGASFAAFLAGYPHAAPLAYLADVARLEWAVHEAERAADAAPLDVAALAQVPPESVGAIRLRLHPSVRRIESPHPVLAIWEANQPGRDGALAAVGAGAVRVCVRRVGSAAVPFALDDAQWQLLVAFEGGATLDTACDALGEAATQLEPALRALAAAGVLAGFEAPPLS